MERYKPFFKESSINIKELIKKIEGGDLAGVNKMLKFDNSVLNLAGFTQKGGYLPPMHIACGTGNLAMVKLIVNNGGNVNQKYVSSTGTIIYPIQCVKPDENVVLIIKFLISKGADPNEGQDEGRSILELSAGTLSLTQIKQIVQLGVKITKGTINVAFKNNVDVIKFLLNQIKISYVPVDWLITVSRLCDIELLKLLFKIERKLNVNQRGPYKRYAICTAAQNNNYSYLIGSKTVSQSQKIEYLKYLVEKGADITVKEEGLTAYEYAVSYSKIPPERVDFLKP